VIPVTIKRHSYCFSFFLPAAFSFFPFPRNAPSSVTTQYPVSPPSPDYPSSSLDWRRNILPSWAPPTSPLLPFPTSHSPGTPFAASTSVRSWTLLSSPFSPLDKKPPSPHLIDIRNPFPKGGPVISCEARFRIKASDVPRILVPVTSPLVFCSLPTPKAHYYLPLRCLFLNLLIQVFFCIPPPPPQTPRSFISKNGPAQKRCPYFCAPQSLTDHSFFSPRFASSL